MITGLNDRVEGDRSLLRLGLLLDHVRSEEQIGENRRSMSDNPKQSSEGTVGMAGVEGNTMKRRREDENGEKKLGQSGSRSAPAS